MTLPTTYRVQDGCHNCRHVHHAEIRGLDSLTYCQLVETNADDPYLAWSRLVHPAGTCDKWEGKP